MQSTGRQSLHRYTKTALLTLNRKKEAIIMMVSYSGTDRYACTQILFSMDIALVLFHALPPRFSCMPEAIAWYDNALNGKQLTILT